MRPGSRPVSKPPVRIPPHLNRLIGPGKIREVNARHLAGLVALGHLTWAELKGITGSGLHPRRINSQIEDLRRRRIGIADILKSAAQAATNRIPGTEYGRIMGAQKGKFMQTFLGVVHEGHRPPYTFLWSVALKRARQKDAHGHWLFTKEFRERFEAGYWSYYEQSRKTFSLKRKIDRYGAEGSLYRRLGEAQKLERLTKQLKAQRREIGRMIGQM